MNEPKNLRVGIGFLVLAGLLMAGWILSRVLVSLYVDGLWFKDLGYDQVFWGMLGVRLKIGFTVLFLAAMMLYGNVWLAFRRSPLTPDCMLANFDMPVERMDGLVRGTLRVMLGVVAVIVGASASGNWVDFVSYFRSTPFGVTEPVFGLDVSWYVFELPLFLYVFKLGLILTLLALAATILAYFVRGAISLDSKHRAFDPSAFRHVSLLGAIAVLFFTGRFWGSRYLLLTDRQGYVFGAGYTDIHASMGAFLILIGLGLILAGWLFFNAFWMRRPANIYAILVFIAAWFMLDMAYPWVVQAFIVRPNEATLEKEYIARSIAFTRKAYGIDDVQVIPSGGDAPLDANALAAAPGTVSNLLIWERAQLRDVFNQKQRIRAYYVFGDVDVDRYIIDGQLQPVAIAARELNPGLLPESSRVWTNLYLQYTHGYGLCMALANTSAEGGLPELLARDMPPVVKGAPQVTEPRIYFGEQTFTYALVGAKLDEFDFPGDPDNNFSRYSAKGGIPLGSRLRRALLSYYTGDKDILFTNQFTPDSRILLHRHIRDRVGTLAPFLRFDEDPYPVLFEGRLVWILDAYTATSRFPYSEPVANANYLRNSVKATVDAYTGETIFYCTDENDPILRVFRSAFPTMFQPFTAMPDDLRKHIRYASDLFKVQTVIYLRYHVDDPGVFFNGEDMWAFPQSVEDNKPTFEQPRYAVLEAPGGIAGPEFVIYRTFTVEGKDNMIGWIAGGCDAESYGKLTLVRFPKSQNTYGPNQAKGRFNQDPKVSEFSTLMGQLGSAITRSKVLVMPIGDSLLYLQSLYIVDPNIKIPELKQVVVGYRDQVAMAPSVKEALSELFPAGPPPPPSAAPASAPETTNATDTTQQPDVSSPAFDNAQAIALYNTARERLQAGDWTGFGKAYDELGKMLGIEE